MCLPHTRRAARPWRSATGQTTVSLRFHWPRPWIATVCRQPVAIAFSRPHLITSARRATSDLPAPLSRKQLGSVAIAYAAIDRPDRQSPPPHSPVHTKRLVLAVLTRGNSSRLSRYRTGRARQCRCCSAPAQRFPRHENASLLNGALATPIEPSCSVRWERLLSRGLSGAICDD